MQNLQACPHLNTVPLRLSKHETLPIRSRTAKIDQKDDGGNGGP